MNFATVRAIRGQLDDGLLKKLIKEAADDDHIVHSATHLILKDNEIAGYFSVGVIPTYLCWLSTKKIKPWDSSMLFTTIENQLAMDPRVASVMTPVNPKSPFHPYAEKFGYKRYYNADIFIKDFYG